jgi:hypothetical protein
LLHHRNLEIRIVGLVPWLIIDGEKGYTFSGRNSTQLSRLLSLSLENPKGTGEIGTMSNHTMVTLWPSKIAAEVFSKLCTSSGENKLLPFDDGNPYSPAKWRTDNARSMA